MTTRILHTTNTSPFGRQVRILLAEKALDYEQNQTRALDRDAGSFALLNPELRVPVLVDGGRTFFDTRIITEYLLTAYPDQNPNGIPPLAPMSTRPQFHFDDAMLLSVLTGLMNTAVNLTAFRNNGVTKEQAPYLARQEERINTSLDWLEERATPKGFLPGVFSMADIGLICAADFGELRNLYLVGERGNLQAIRERYAKRLSVLSTKPA